MLELLEKVGVDYLGVSLDALLIYCSDTISEQIISDLASKNIKCSEIGYVDNSNQVNMIYEGEEKKSILPKFRESAYTKIKQEIGEETPELKLEMEIKIEKAATEALKKRQKIIDHIRKQSFLNV